MYRWTIGPLERDFRCGLVMSASRLQKDVILRLRRGYLRRL
jgi:hypothetical protein